MKKKARKEKRPLTYKEEHNKTLDRFRKSSRLLIWVGAFNVISLLVAIIQYASGTGSLFFYFCFGCNDLLFQAIARIPNFFINHTILYFVIIVIIALITTAGAVLLGVFASQGKKKFLFGSLIFYMLDTLCIIPCAFLGETYISILSMSVLHVAILSIIVIAVYEYYKIINIAKKHGILKEKEESGGEQNGTI